MSSGLKDEWNFFPESQEGERHFRKREELRQRLGDGDVYGLIFNFLS